VVMLLPVSVTRLDDDLNVPGAVRETELKAVGLMAK